MRARVAALGKNQLRLARQRKRVQNRELLRYARLLRVEKPMSPYLQAIE
jgi:hypothetical protein